MQLVILAGGWGRRMKPWTDRLPKSLIPTGEGNKRVPFVDRQLAHAAAQGLTRILLCTGVGGDQIEAHLGTGEQFGLAELKYSREPVGAGRELLGTGGALRLALERGLLAERFLLLYGDSFLPIDFAKVADEFLHQEKPALMTIYRNRDAYDRSNVIYDEASGRILLYDKGRTLRGRERFEHIDYGLTAMEASLIEAAGPAGYAFDLASLFQDLSLEGLLAGFVVEAPFYEIGSPEGLARFEEYLRSDGA